jgi:chromosome segregation ATPase
MELYWIAGIIIVVLIPLVIKISQMPADKFFKRRRPVVPPPAKVMDWETISKRWEKNNAVLTNEIETLKKERKSLIDQIEDDKKIVNEYLEQLAREKAWREKETQVVEKVKNVDHELKEELRKAQNQLNEEHTLKLKMDIELQESKLAISRLKEEVRALTVKLMAVEKESEGANKELKDLRRTNAELKKQKEDIQWVAKSDYDEIVLKFKKVESELGRLTRDQKTDT